MMDVQATLQVEPDGERAVRIKRTFAAARDLVFRAMTEPELLARWLTGPEGWETAECTGDAVVGGTFRHVWVHEDGRSMAMSGVYREVVPPARVVRTETFEFGCEAQAREQVATLTLEEKGDMTVVDLLVIYPSSDARDAALASGMSEGMNDSYCALDRFLERT